MKLSMLKSSWLMSHWPFVLVLIGYLLFSLATYDDFGVTFDEHDTYFRGQLLYTYFRGNDPVVEQSFADTLQFANPLQIYNHAYAAFLYMIDGRQRYEIYHLLNMLLMTPLLFLSYWVFYRLSQSRLAILAPLSLLLLPRLVGHLPANPKDGPFAILYSVALLLMVLTQTAKPLVRVFVLGVVFGMVHASRILGLGVYGFYGVYFLLTHWRPNWPTLKRFFTELLVIGTIGLSLHVITQPFLYEETIPRLISLARFSKAYPWDGEMLFMGTIYKAGTLPWYYIPVWIGVTTPVTLLVGLLLSMRYVNRSHSFSTLLWIFIEVHFLLLIILRPNIYDGLRHFLFLLPPIGLLAGYAFIHLAKLLTIKKRLLVAVLLSVSGLQIWLSMRELHPYQYVYFNSLVGGLAGAESKFETDYWGASLGEAAKWLVNNVPLHENTVLYHCGSAMQLGYYLPDSIRVRKDVEQASFAICTTRNNLHLPLIAQGEVLHTVSRDGVSLSHVIRLGD